MSLQETTEPPGYRERLIAAGYELVMLHGVNGTGLAKILDKAGCARRTFYNNFESKTELMIAVLQHREEQWTRNWLETDIKARSSGAESQLIAIFEMYDYWFQRPDFEGCTFVRVFLEHSVDTEIRDAVLTHLQTIRQIVEKLADEAKLQNINAFCDTWQVLMDGAIVGAYVGNKSAALVAKRLAETTLKTWPRR